MKAEQVVVHIESGDEFSMNKYGGDPKDLLTGVPVLHIGRYEDPLGLLTIVFEGGHEQLWELYSKLTNFINGEDEEDELL